MTRDFFDLLAAVVDYPDEYISLVVGQAAARAENPAMKAALDSFLEVVSQLSVEELREHYAATFRPGTACSLELAEQLYTDPAERNAFVTRQLGALRRTGLQPLGAVPDHLTRVLALIGRDDPARAVDLASLVGPAVEAIRCALVNRHSPYAEVLGVVKSALLQVRPAPVGPRG